MKRKETGVTLIELMIGVVIMGILLMLAAPSYQSYIRNTKIRASAESILNGLQLARGEAVRRNAAVRFQLTDSVVESCALTAADTEAEPNWVVSIDDPAGKCNAAPIDEDKVLTHEDNKTPYIIQVRPAGEGQSGTVAKPSADFVRFSALGRLLGTGGDAATAVTIQIKTPDVADCEEKARCLCVTVSIGGQTRLCDPKLPQADPQSCYERSVQSCTIN